MTFSICVREEYTDDDGERQTRFGVAVTTRLPGVGTLCPFVSENGAVATQSLVNVELGRKGVQYLDDGLSVKDALQSLLNADDGAEQRQLHGVDADGTFTFSGEECQGWYGHTSGENYTVAGNLLAGEAVVEAVADTYESDAFGDAPLAERLVDALEAGHAEGGDKREHLPIQSAALLVESTEDVDFRRAYNDLRVDATETPVADLRETFEEAQRGHEILLEEYGEELGDDEGAEDAADADDAAAETDAE
ncbi:DUF1028 domain-containing protein [Halobaculum limi]|uniref:DUF1028 domain-containing protein n=1 Tax=Halobaculum limi TaxID=3031916 RepID=UPI002407020D|nr:DUF1028 domain-containing protein [Halobaculum sp. YSMS11]